MRLFFNQIQSEITIANPNALDKWINQMVESKKGKIKPTAIFIGDFSATEFKLELKRISYNTFRPVIYGEISNGKLKIKLGLKKRAFIFLGIGYLMIALSIIKSGSWVFLVAAVVWTLFWYFMGLLFFTMEKRKTLEGLEKIKKVCA